MNIFIILKIKCQEILISAARQEEMFLVKEQLVLILEACSVQVVQVACLILEEVIQLIRETKEHRPSHQLRSLVVYLEI